MFAVIKLSGKQYSLKEKETIQTDRINLKEGEKFMVKDVLLAYNGDIKIGNPYIPNASVELKIVSHGRSKKIRVFKMKAKKRYKREKSCRRYFTKLEVIKIKT